MAVVWRHLTLRLAIIVLCCQSSSVVQAATNLTFCYQDQPLSPYYLGEGDQVKPEHPGATIEHLQSAVAAIPALTLKLVRFPWQRCLKLLQNGSVDAVVANYSEERRTLGVFPMRQDQPDPDREFAMQEICIVTHKQLAKKWNGSHFDDTSKVIVAHQAGRNLQHVFSHRQFIQIPVSAQAKALQLLERDKVNAVTMVCKIAGKNAVTNSFNPNTMQVLEPSIETLHGYLIFSHQFYQQHPKLAEALWHQASKTPIDIYLKYLNNDTLE
jgi:polar amino acid transport system substrate-binding protein